MLVKLAFRNVRRSVRDYGVYFVTLVFGVAVFYAFNSVTSQSVLFDLEGSASADVFELTGQFLGMFSMLIACVLGFLVLYANRFLIKRRKREFGTYLMLGMKPGNVSAIVLMETFVVGIVSLVAGLVFGFILSQGLSFVTAGLFNIPMNQYRFVFSLGAFALTLGCFAIIFVIAALLNTLSIRRYRLIDLLSARSKNERYRTRNPWVSLAVFILSIGVLAIAYVTLIDNGLMEFDAGFWRATAFMVIGTFLFFWSIAGFVLAVVEHTRGIYFKGLAMFTMRQIASKVNTAFVSLSVICIMLFFSFTVFSTGMGLVRVLSDNLDESTLYDASLTANVFMGMDDIHDTSGSETTNEDGRTVQEALDAQETAVENDGEKWHWDMAAKLADVVPGWIEFVGDSRQIDCYQWDDTTYGDLIDRYGVTGTGEVLDKSVRDQKPTIIGVSQFNGLAESIGRPTVDVGESGYAVNNVLDATETLSKALVDSKETIQIGGHSLTSTNALESLPLTTATFLNDGAELIVPDSVIETLNAAGVAPNISYLDIEYAGDRSKGDELLEKGLAAAFPPDEQMREFGWAYQSSPWPVTTYMTSDGVLDQAGGLTMLITYLALYIGFVFLITTAAILAVQQLSETSDSLSRYRVLAELGCDRRMILGSLRTQVLVYFFAPLVPAVAHTVCAVGVISENVFEQLGVSVVGPAALTVLLVMIVYGTYLLVAYYASKGIIRASLGKKLLG